MGALGKLTNPHSSPVDDALRALEADREQGLSNQQARQRLDQYGPNELRVARRRSAVKILLAQFKSMVIIVLLVAGIVAAVTQRWPETIAIAAVIAINTLLGFFAEYRAVRSMEALRAMTRHTTRVRREGQEQEIETQSVVPGDIVLLEAEDMVPADLRILRADQLRVNEAALTGESVPDSKDTKPVKEDTSLADRTCMLYKGTSVSDGTAEALAVATGMDTELGRISKLAEEAESGATPLERKLNDLGRRLAWIVVAVAIVIAGFGLAAGRETVKMVETAIALGVAAIPEGLPIVATLGLARGMWLMAKRNVIINNLNSVETLGATRVIFTDKTGTLTENRMDLGQVVTPNGEHRIRGEQQKPPDDPLFERAVQIGVLCNGASLGDEEKGPKGDPTEIALLKGGRQFGWNREKLLKDRPEQREMPFNSDVKMMATFHPAQDGYYVAVKGAPSAVLENCNRIASGSEGERQLTAKLQREWENTFESLASEGLRLLAVAEKIVQDLDAEPYQDLCFVGVLGLIDPPRHEVRDSINECQHAGIRVIMVTGDQPTTAAAIGRQVGIGDEEEAPTMHGRDLKDPDEMTSDERQRVHDTVVFARVSPEQKLNLIKLYQERGETVAMTGDGVNDTPALKKADIGVAMGKRGTDAARQVSDMILRDDSFSSIVAAVKQGRIIFANIRKSAVFMLCTNIAEVIAVGIGALAGIPIPLRPLQILYLNVLTDVFPAMALAGGKGEPHVMDREPRPPREPVLTTHHWRAIVAWSVLIAACVLAALGVAWGWFAFDEKRAVTISFLTLGFSKLWFVFNLRDRGSSFFRNDVIRNPWIWGAIVLCAALLLAAVYLPGLNDILSTEDPGWKGWLLLLGLSLIPLLVGFAVPQIRFYGTTGRESTTEVADRLAGKAESVQAAVEENRELIDQLAESRTNGRQSRTNNRGGRK